MIINQNKETLTITFFFPINILGSDTLKVFFHKKLWQKIHLCTVNFFKECSRRRGKFFMEFISVTSITDVSSREVWLASKLLTYLFTDHLFSRTEAQCVHMKIHSARNQYCKFHRIVIKSLFGHKKTFCLERFD